MSNIFAIVSGIGLFALTISWWLSPFTPIEAQPQMGSADLHITATGPVLNGTALLPPDEHLWLLVGSQDKWRPLHRIGVDFATGAWTTAVEPDAFRELGCDARVAIFAVSRKSDQRLQSYVINTSGLRTHTLDSMPEGSKLQHIFNSSIPPNCSSDTTRTQAKPKALQKESTQTNIGAKPLFSPSQGSGDEGGPIAIGVCTHPSGQRALEMQAELNRNVESFKKHPENRDTQLEIAFLQSELGNLDTAEDTLNHVELRNDPNALNYLGLVYLRKCRLPEAIRTFQSAELLRPQGLVAESILANLTHAMWITKRPNKTVEYLENCVRSCRTTDGEAYFRLGDAYLALHDQESARQAFVQVENITVDPDLRARASSKLQIIQSGTRSASSRD
jgi:tetratricopeptide (TPR) repeat protein